MNNDKRFIEEYFPLKEASGDEPQKLSLFSAACLPVFLYTIVLFFNPYSHTLIIDYS